MTRLKRPLVLVTVVTAALLAVALPARAFHCPTDGYYPILDTDAFSGTGWVAYRIEAGPSNIVGYGVTSEARHSSSRAFGIWLLDEGGSVHDVWVEATNNGQGVLLHGQAVEDEFVVDRHEVGSRSLAGIGTFTSVQPGTYIVVIAVTGEGSFVGETELCGDSFTILAKTQGTDGFLAGDREFSGTLNVVAGTPKASASLGSVGVSAPSLSARGAVAAKVTRSFDKSFFGAFLTGFTDAYVRIGYDGPSGSQDGRSEYLFSGAEPGTYQFREDIAAGAGLAGTWAWGVDVSLP